MNFPVDCESVLFSRFYYCEKSPRGSGELIRCVLEWGLPVPYIARCLFKGRQFAWEAVLAVIFRFQPGSRGPESFSVHHLGLSVDELLAAQMGEIGLRAGKLKGI